MSDQAGRDLRRTFPGKYRESELGYDYGGLPDPIPQDWETLLTFELPGSDSW